MSAGLRVSNPPGDGSWKNGYPGLVSLKKAYIDPPNVIPGMGTSIKRASYPEGDLICVVQSSGMGIVTLDITVFRQAGAWFVPLGRILSVGYGGVKLSYDKNRDEAVVTVDVLTTRQGSGSIGYVRTAIARLRVRPELPVEKKSR